MVDFVVRFRERFVSVNEKVECDIYVINNFLIAFMTVFKSYFSGKYF